MSDKIQRAAMIGLLMLGLLFLYQAYQEHRPFAEAKAKQAAIQEAVLTYDAPEDPLERRIDFETLKGINPDIIGWLYIPQIGVDHPILMGRTASSYLNLDFEGNYSPLGSVFTWPDTEERLTDSHICLFAHNMPSGQMFGQLKNFQDQDFVKENSTVYLYTPERSKKLKVCATSECRMTDAVFQKGWQNESGRQTVTLSTCVGYDATPYRLTVTCEVLQEKIVL